ncbi:tail fiber assembly protein [Siccibacter colletis]|nr:tail fiber assembly protein [Siccibacter colletis]
MRYSPSLNGFYPENNDYPNLPKDVMIIPDELYLELLNGQAAGKVITPHANKKGYPFLTAQPEPSSSIAPVTRPADTAAQSDATEKEAEQMKSSLRSYANGFINERQWPSRLALGRLSEEEKAAFNSWLDYLDALESVDTSSAPEISWPAQPVE